MELPLDLLRSALKDRSRFVRMGAAAALAYLAPGAAAALLDERADTLPVGETEPEEMAALGLGLARAGSDKHLGLAASVLKDDRQAVFNVLTGRERKSWIDYIDLRGRSVGLSDQVREMLASYRAALSGEWTERVHDVAIVPPPISAEERSKNALEAFERWREVFAEAISMRPSSEEKLQATIEHLRAADVQRARDDLLAFAIAEPDPAIRAIAGRALPAFGLDASAPLLATLSGQPGLKPPRAVYPTIREEARARFSGMNQRELAKVFAAEALQQFTDDDTARAITSAALAWEGEPQAFAERVLARMPVEAALPELAWSSVNRPDAADRAGAHGLLDRIVKRDPDLGIDTHRFGPNEAIPGGLDWLEEIAGRAPNTRDWTAYLYIAVPVLREAIALMPRAVLHTIPETAQAALRGASDFVRSVPTTGLFDSVKRTFGFGGARRATRLPRYPQARFPERCKRDDEAVLEVRLLPTAADGTHAPFEVPFEKGAETTELVVLAHCSGFEITEKSGLLHVPREGPSDTATFHMRASHVGEWVIDIKFMLGTAELCHCVVPTAVVLDAATGGNAMLNPVEHFTEDALHRHGEASIVLQVKTNFTTERLDWSVLEPGAREARNLGSSPQRFNNAAIDTWNEQNAQTLRDLVEADLKDLNGALAFVSGQGSSLFEQVVPEAAADELRKLPPDALVVIESDADWVPWELLAIDAGGPPLGDRFVLVRAPLVTKRPTKPPNAPTAVPATLTRALLVVGDDIKNHATLSEQTFGTYADRASPPLVEPNWERLTSNAKDRDIVHFVCHGRGKILYLSYGADPGSRFAAKQAHELGFLPGAVVFANACKSGTASAQLSDFQSFGREFYLAGARPYIGTLGPVPQSLAVPFSALFYSFFALQGLSAAQAMRLARHEAAKTFKRPVWLLYCLYGNTPMARRWSASS
jgi:hypothetical protein